MPANGGDEQSISLLRCVVLTRHLERIIGAINRAVQHRGIGVGQLVVSEFELEVNGHPATIQTVESDAMLRRLRSRVLKAITPGTIVVDSSPAVCDFQSRHIGPIVFPELDGRCISRSHVTLHSIGIYKVDEPSARAKSLLRRIGIPPSPEQDTLSGAGTARAR